MEGTEGSILFLRMEIEGKNSRERKLQFWEASVSEEERKTSKGSYGLNVKINNQGSWLLLIQSSLF